MLRVHFKETYHMAFDGGKTAQGLRLRASVTGGMVPSLHTWTSYLDLSTFFVYKTEKNIPYSYISDMIISLN